MEESNERPAKIRKLDSYSGSDGGVKTTLDKPAESCEIFNGSSTSQASPSPGQSEAKTSNENEAIPANTEVEVQATPLSKSQLKKIRKRELWEAGREYRKAERRRKGKEKKLRRASTRAAEVAEAESKGETLSLPQKAYHRPVQLPITFLLDCDFDNLMTEKEIMSLGSQITRCYSDNRSPPFRCHLVVASFGGTLKERYETVLANHHLGWKGVRFTEQDFVEAAAEAHRVMHSEAGGKLAGALAVTSDEVDQKDDENNANEIDQGQDQENTEIATTQAPDSDSPKTVPPDEKPPSIVYLTSDSPHTLTVLHPYTTYIIGGIVDKNRHKGLCYKRACERGIPTAKLPISEYMTMQSRSVLATNHVVEIMLRWLEDGDWGKAFVRVIPKRKEAKLKEEDGRDGKEEEEGEEEDDHDPDTGEMEDDDAQSPGEESHEEGKSGPGDIEAR